MRKIILHNETRKCNMNIDSDISKPGYDSEDIYMERSYRIISLPRKLITSTLVLLLALTPLTSCSLSFRKHVIDETDSFDPADSETVIVDALVKELRVSGDPGLTEVSISLKGTIWAAYQPKIIIDRIGKTITVRTHEKTLLGTSTGRNELEMIISIPSEYEGEISLSTVSGKIDFQDMSPEKIDISTVSADISIDNTDCTEADFSSVSGLISYSDSIAESINAESVSGDIILLDIDTTDLKAKNVSGDVIIESPRKTGNIDITTVSGDVIIETDNKAGFTMSFTTVSGDLKSGSDLVMKEFDGRNITAVSGNGEHSVKVSTISGKLRID